MNLIKDFVKMSKYAGERIDLVQAGGGNTSVKLDDGTMLIKASGFLLSDVELDKGYVKVRTKEVNDIMENTKVTEIEDKKQRERAAADVLKSAIIDESAFRPSIETFLHSMLGRFTLHTHPVVVNAITCRKNWLEVIKSLFPRCVVVDYQTPGIDLALELKKQFDLYVLEYKEKPQLIFLQNHGLIASGHSLEEVISLNESVLLMLEGYLRVDYTYFRNSNRISGLVNSIGDESYIAYMTNDVDLLILGGRQDLLNSTPFCPDTYVFCGASILALSNLEDLQVIRTYLEQFHELPKVVYFEKRFYFIANNIKKAKEMEDVFKFHLLSLSLAENNINFLSMEEMNYLGNWDSEKYRQKL